ncbi:hypothetical protein dsat_0867 [Alkalidesulfovibrio alkalitolerans DSM 16529]|jgi:predicted glycosyltransferase|uniref:Glycosyl transferase family 28 C-terminal domain-containing protein n=1 Tax=Alkalidesulfovibrio alkalitolerans DSM 16529 TaxID=1121439 RepID=S7UH15_9BACT|nr:hypothetical protein [Alkalidesulfovibrio alkalitolerans]EPR31543.1 hypothetical protein dsat_0867 [Alkalidesulfovibrio alkalitolerans DSM 16529]
MKRLDILLYAHDGRGVGHASRVAALGLALVRRHPAMRVAMLTGERRVASLLRGLPLEWIKMPSYATSVRDGRSSGAAGDCGLSDADLGEARAELIASCVRIFRPRVFVADHTPQGKHRELLPAIEERGDTRFVLGVRAVVGGVDKVWSDLAASVFASAYSGILWYGDAALCGDEAARLFTHFGREPVACGYVSRLLELAAAGRVAQGMREGVVVGLSWRDAGFLDLLQAVTETANEFPGLSPWRVFCDLSGNGQDGEADALRSQVLDVVRACPHLRLEEFGEGYGDALMSARAAVVYGGYNSLTDILAAGLPAVVLLRGMRDQEQEDHARRLAGVRPGITLLPADGLGAADLADALRGVMAHDVPIKSPVPLDGAARAADVLAEMARAAREMEK